MGGNSTIQDRLLKSFEKYKDKIAVEYGSHTITYEELNIKSNYIANWVLARGLEKGTFIGLMLEDRVDFIIAMLGVLKAGCVFVPIGGSYPKDRIKSMIETTELAYIITDQNSIKNLTDIGQSLSRGLKIITVNEGLYSSSNITINLKEVSNCEFNENERTRYKRQMLLDNWGIEGQKKLKDTKVFVAGAGGSASPLIQQLALVGFGTIVVCDFDEVELSNLNRQILHDESRIGMNKALSAEKTINIINPNINVVVHQERINSENALQLVGDCSIIFDNVDDLGAKSALSEVAVKKGIPHVISSMIQINSYAAIFHTPKTPCFHCLYDKEKIEQIKELKRFSDSYEDKPVPVSSPALFLCTGFIVNEVIKLILGYEKTAYNKYFLFNQYGSRDIVDTYAYEQITYSFSEHFKKISKQQGFDWDEGWSDRYVAEIDLERDPNCPVCSGAYSEVHNNEGTAENDYYKRVVNVEYLPEDEIYIYFTSGTKGKPKAVLGKNISLAQFINWEIQEFSIGEDVRSSQFITPAFDAFLRDLFVPLCSGGRLLIPEDMGILADSEELIAWIDRNRINLIHCVPSIFRVFNTQTLTGKEFDGLRHILLSGEKINSMELKDWYEKFNERIELVNLYGATETTMTKTFYRIKRSDVDRERIPIGKPIRGARLIILDKYMKPCDEGFEGEIYIRTPYRTYGYYNLPDMNEKVFIQNPFSDNPEDLIYKTGDLGKYLADGNVDLLGRIDRQVKVRGIRIELEGIENVLLKHPLIKEGVAVKRTINGSEALVVYVTGFNDNEIDVSLFIEAIKEYLVEKLPMGMIPNQIIKLREIPKKINGKIDYQALPEPVASKEKVYIPPRNEMEKRMAMIWSEILGIKEVSINDSFFGLGGNSLDIMALISKLHKEFNIKISFGEIFNNPTIDTLSKIINTGGKSIYKSIKAQKKEKYYPLSSAQNRLYILHSQKEENTSYNMPSAILIEGNIERNKVEETFIEVINRHDSLRTSFDIVGEKVVQRVHDDVEFKLRYREMEKKTPVDGIIQDFIRSFDLSKAPLFRAELVKLGENSHILIFDMHHIISDGISIVILLDEFCKIYKGDKLSDLKLQYKDYAIWQNEIMKSSQLEKQEEYWLNKFRGEIPLLNVATDYQRPPIKNFEGEDIRFELDLELVKKLKSFEAENEITLFMLLLSAFNILLYSYSGQEDIVVGSPISGRPHQDLENIIGMFVNMLPLRNYPRGEKTFIEFLEEVKTSTLEAFENQDYQFEDLVTKLGIGKDYSRNPLFSVVFSFKNMINEDMSFEGLTLKGYGVRKNISKFDFTFDIFEIDKRILINLEYSTQLFKKSTMERIRDSYIHILNQVADDKNIKIVDAIANHELITVEPDSLEIESFDFESLA
ncbi:condensation domain-containing protein [Wukongibacter sp. M2B1]|uniref:HesA/MoeB/ThiF family protein n=1 Tax=Wukongibacter sp. M2B1 TaxID=3088895 RepID=UPI003D7AA24A